MKFFVKGTYDAWASIQPFVRALEAYKEHLKRVLETFPSLAGEFATQDWIDDALLIEAIYQPAEKTLRLKMRSGNLQVGYYDTILDYTGVKITERHLARLDQWFQGDGAFHELHDRNGRIEQRILFHSRVWVAIQCDSIKVRKVPKPSRKFLKKARGLVIR